MRIILADPNLESLNTLRMMLVEDCPEVNLVGEVIDAQELLRMVEAEKPELVLLDYRLPGASIAELVTRLHESDPAPLVIVMSGDIVCSRMALRAGADAFVSKGDQPELLFSMLDHYILKLPGKETNR